MAKLEHLVALAAVWRAEQQQVRAQWGCICIASTGMTWMRGQVVAADSPNLRHLQAQAAVIAAAGSRRLELISPAVCTACTARRVQQACGACGACRCRLLLRSS